MRTKPGSGMPGGVFGWGRLSSPRVPAGVGGAAAHDDGGVQEVPQDGTRAVHGAAQRAPGAARG